MPVDHFHHKNRLEPTQQSHLFIIVANFHSWPYELKKIAPASHHPRPSKPVGAYLGSVQADHSIA